MPTVDALGEFGLIRRILAPSVRQTVKSWRRKGWSLPVGIGDDTAVLRPPSGKELLFASDMLVEGVHFHRSEVSSNGIGWKALARNVSDIAAMGGQPVAAVVSLGLPPSTDIRLIRGIYRGLGRCARRFNLVLAGGDTVRAPQLVIDVAILGEVKRGKAITRGGVRAGDALFVTGCLGNAYRSGYHARFIPRLEEAHVLLRLVRIHGMIDLSDGLAAGLWQLADASHVQLAVDAEAIPRRITPGEGASSLRQALTAGEDFELLFSVAQAESKRVPRRIGSVPVTLIGRAVAGKLGVTLIDARGRQKPLSYSGFQHFLG